MNRTYCNFCGDEITSRDQSAMQTIVGDFGANVTTFEGKTVRIGALITIDGICGPADFDMCVRCWSLFAPYFVATPTPLSVRQQRMLERMERDGGIGAHAQRLYENPGQPSIWSRFHLWKGRRDD